MGVRAVLSRVAAGATARVFPVVGVGGRDAVDRLRLDERVTLLDSPRSANVLFLSGWLTERLVPAALSAHDAMSEPRAVVQSRPGGQPDPLAAMFREVLAVDREDAVAGALQSRQRALIRREASSSTRILPDVDPAPWRGIGPYRQGGKGMSGGVPFGRPLPGRAPDRDGLELDQLTVRVGPALPPLPPGLVLEVRLQGDVIQEARLIENAFGDASVLSRDPSLHDPFQRALVDPVPVAELEVARARHHLRWLGGALRGHGLDALGLRVLRVSRQVAPGEAGRVRSIERLLRRIRTLDAATAGIGVVPGESVAGVGGPVARAAGIPVDLRTEEPAYRELGFAPLTHSGGDARARWRQRLGEAAQALELAARAGDRTTRPTGQIESPRGRLTPEEAPSTGLVIVLTDLLAGQEWGDAVTIATSLDLDMEEAARAEARPAVLAASGR